MIPANQNTSQEAVELYLSVFDAASVENRMSILAGAGVNISPTAKVRALGLQSLTWATAAEVGLQAFATVRDPETLASADAAVAALRVARGLANDRRSVEDPLIDELLAAAQILTVTESESEGLVNLHTEFRVYLDNMRTGTCSPSDYLDSLRTHSNGVAGVILRDMHLADSEISAGVHDFGVSLGTLYQLTTDLREEVDDVSHGNSISRAIAAEMMAADATCAQITAEIVTSSRLLLQTIKHIQRHYAHNPLLEEITVRANITLRDCAVLLKQGQTR